MAKRVSEVSKDVAIVARKVEGYCSAGIKEGDKIVIRGPNIDLEETDAVCGYAFSSVFPTVFALLKARCGFTGNRPKREIVAMCGPRPAPHSRRKSSF